MPNNFMAYYVIGGITAMVLTVVGFTFAGEGKSGEKIPPRRLIPFGLGLLGLLAWIGVGAYMEIAKDYVASTEPAGTMARMTVTSSGLGGRITQIETEDGRYFTVAGAFPGKRGAPLVIEHRENGADFLCVKGVSASDPCRNFAD